MKSTKPTVSFAESLGILIALLAILGYLIIGQKLTPHIPILFVFIGSYLGRFQQLWSMVLKLSQ